MFRNRSASSHSFAMVPRADIPRSSFNMQKTLKTTFDSGWLIPIMCEEVLPGDTFNVKMTAFARLATPLFPVMDNMYLETFFFFVPNRLVWNNWERFMGEQANPADSISFTIPTVVSLAGGYSVNGLGDYFGLPTVGQVSGGGTITNSVLPFRCYNMIWNEWFRDQNLQNAAPENKGDGPDLVTDYAKLRRGKRHDYFTSALPWTQKGGVAISLPLGVSAPIKTQASNLVTGVQSPLNWLHADGTALPGTSKVLAVQTGTGATASGGNATIEANRFYPANLYADLSSATAATINQIRQAFQIQRLLERDARGGTRYAELVRSHFNVVSPDARLQRAEYLGGGKTPISVNPIAQTSSTGLTGGSTPLGSLAAMATGLARNHGFSQSFVEHGHVIGLCHVGADLTYQQGMRRMWSRRTRYDFYFPVFAHLGEQAILNKEIYARGDANDDLVFGYQERWAEYRYNPSEITGLFRSTAAGTIDPWHLSQRFTSLPTLNATFIEDNPPLDRILAVGAAANGKQILLDAFFDTRAARPLPMYSQPGFIDRF